MKLLFFLFFITVFSVATLAQSAPCLKIESITNQNQFTSGEPVVLRAVVNKEIATIGAKFKWELSDGHIASGENTDSITIDSKKLGGDITVTVEIEGIAALCQKSASFAFEVEPPEFVCGLALDTFAINEDWEMTSARLNNLSIELNFNENVAAYFLLFRGKNDSFDKVKARLLKMRKYLSVKRKISSERIILGVEERESNQTSIQLYLRPKEAVKSLPNENTIIIENE